MSPNLRGKQDALMEININDLVKESLNGNGIRMEGSQSLTTIPEPPPVHEDPFLSVRDALWFHTSINDLVRIALEKMDKAFAYNSVFFLKAVLDLQVQYLALQPPPPAKVKLEFIHVQRIADILSVRLARREKDGSSLSRELQLRTLVSALTLLSQSKNFRLDNDAYASLLHRLSERDHDNLMRYSSAIFGCGDTEYLARYACDLVRCMPNDFAMYQIGGFGSQAVHFMLAAGLVNQSDSGPTLEYMEEIYNRITAQPSNWHESVYELFNIVLHTVYRGYHSLSRRKAETTPVYLDILPENVTRTIIKRIKLELSDFELSGSGEPREIQLIVTALLDLLVNVVATFPSCEEAIESSEQLGLQIITTCDIRELRLKAFELIIASTTGCDETEFFDAMRDLESYILKEAASGRGLDVEELRKEKRAAMDRYEKKMILYRGAIESLHRRLQDKDRGGRNITDRALTASPSWERIACERAAISPAPSGTIFSQSISGSPTSLFASAFLKNDPITMANNIQHYAPPTPNPPETPNPDHQPSTPYGLQAIGQENGYFRGHKPGPASCSQLDEFTLNERPLSFQRNASEILHLPSQRRKKIKPLPAVEAGEENVLSYKNGAHPFEIVVNGLGVTEVAMNQNKETVALAVDIIEPTFSAVGNGITASGSEELKERHPGTREREVAQHEVVMKELPTVASDHAEEVPTSNENDTKAHIVPETVDQTLNLKTAFEDETQTALPHPPDSQALQPDPFSEKIPVCSPTGVDDGTQAKVEGETTSEFEMWNNSLLRPGDRGTKCSFDLPLQGVNDEEYCLPKEGFEGRERRPSALSPIPVDSEFTYPDNVYTESKFSIIRDGSDAPEVVEVSPAEVYGDIPVKNEVHLIPKKKPSRAYRLLASLPGSSVKGRSGGRLSRFGSLRFSSSQATPAPVDRSKIPIITDDESPEIIPPICPLALRKSQTGPDIYNEKMEILRRHTNIRAPAVIGSASPSNTGRTSPPNFFSELTQTTPVKQDVATYTKPEYGSIATEQIYKLTPKENFMPFLTLDCRHVVYMSGDGFQVFLLPTLVDGVPTKPRHTYRLGEAEGLKKGGVPWEYKSGAASRRYIATITKEMIQLHDLQKSCEPIFTRKTEDHEYYSIAIAADKMAVGMAPINGSPGAGVITIFKMREPTNVGQKWEEWKIIRLLIPPSGYIDHHGAPYLLSLTRDGKGLTACTKSGHFFAWDITGQNEPVLISSGRVITEEGTPGSEILTGALLFPDMNHVLCSTMSTSEIDPGWVGCFTEPTRFTAQPPPHNPIRQVGLKLHHCAISPNGSAIAFLGRTGRINIVPVLRVEGDPNVTTTAATSAVNRLHPSVTPESAGRIMFTPEGDKLICVDRKGKVAVLCFTKF